MTVLQRTYHQKTFHSTKITSSKRRKHLYLCAYRIWCWLAAFNVKWYPGSVTGGKHWKCLLLKYLYFLGPQRPTMPFLTYAYFHYSDIKQTEECCCCCLSAVLSPSLWSASLTGCENSSPREYPYPMSPWGRRPEDTLWGCIERCCGKRII